MGQVGQPGDAVVAQVQSGQGCQVSQALALGDSLYDKNIIILTDMLSILLSCRYRHLRLERWDRPGIERFY